MHKTTKIEQILEKAKKQSKQNINQAKLDLNDKDIVELEIDLIETNPYQPRKTFNKESIMELAESIKIHGLIQAILVTKRDDKYILITGERRLRAFKALNKHTIQANIRENVTDKELKEIALIENIQREDINIIDEAFAFKELSNDGLSLRDISRFTGKSKTHIARMLKICGLEEKTLEIARNHNLYNPNILEVLTNYDADIQFKLINQLRDGNLSLKQAKNILNNKNIEVSPEGTKSKYPFNLPKIESVNISKRKNVLHINIDLNKFNNKNIEMISKHILEIKEKSKK